MNHYLKQIARYKESDTAPAPHTLAIHTADSLIRGFLVSYGLNPDDKALVSATKDGCRILAVEILFEDSSTNLYFTDTLSTKISSSHLQKILPSIYKDPLCTTIVQSVGPQHRSFIKEYNHWFDAAKISILVNVPTTVQALPGQKGHSSDLSMPEASETRRIGNRGDGLSRPPDVRRSASINIGWIPAVQGNKVPRSPGTGAAPPAKAALCHHPGSVAEMTPLDRDSATISHSKPAVTRSAFAHQDAVASMNFSHITSTCSSDIACSSSARCPHQVLRPGTQYSCTCLNSPRAEAAKRKRMSLVILLKGFFELIAVLRCASAL